MSEGVAQSDSMCLSFLLVFKSQNRTACENVHPLLTLTHILMHSLKLMYESGELPIKVGETQNTKIGSRME